MNKKIDATPTKDLFIFMLTRDIDIKPAVLELIDNSIDGVKRCSSDKKYDSYYIKISLSKDKFVIEDNCGGIPVITAQKYAFKFGRSPERTESFEGLFTGIFGIGMKRALFKLGNRFTVESTTETEHFTLNINVHEWIKTPEWEFEFDNVQQGMNNETTGTKIIVEDLNDDVSSKFQSQLFINTLIDYIQKHRSVEFENGLKIMINDYAVEYRKEELLRSNVIQPYESVIIDGDSKIIVTAGITKKGQPQKAGWYIYCNGRLVVYADKTELSGWGNEIRAFHNSLAEFRGYVYFQSNKLLDLPWNTTKTGIDSSNRLYLIAKNKMIEATKQIISVITEVKKNYNVTDLDDIDFVQKANLEPLTYSKISNINTNKDFDIIQKEPKEKVTFISFYKPERITSIVKEHLGVNTNRILGERLFDYYCDMEEIHVRE